MHRTDVTCEASSNLMMSIGWPSTEYHSQRKHADALKKTFHEHYKTEAVQKKKKTGDCDDIRPLQLSHDLFTEGHSAYFDFFSEIKGTRFVHTSFQPFLDSFRRNQKHRLSRLLQNLDIHRKRNSSGMICNASQGAVFSTSTSCSTI